jgi:hypothetical protein
MQIAEVRKMITDIYNVLTYAKEYADIQKYLLTAEYIHDGFWPLHKELIEAKAELRVSVNNVTESTEKVEALMQSISNLIERDKQNRRKNMNAKIEVVVVEGKL